MRTFKDSGIEWLGLIPETWRITRGKNILRLLQRPVKGDDGVITCFRDGEVTLRSNRRTEGFTVSLKEIGYQGIEPGDLVVHGMDGFAGSIGISDSRGKASPVLNVLDTTQNKRYLMYYLRALAYREVYLALADGIRVRSCNLSWKKIGELPIVVPEASEQTRIADYLDEECVEIDEAVKTAQSAIEEYEDYLKEVTHRLVMGFRETSGSRIDTGIEWLGTIPNHWRLVPFRHVYREVSRDGYENEQLLSVYLNRGVIPYEESDGMQVHKPSESLAKYQLVLPGNLVLNNQQAWRGSVGVSFHQGIISPAYHVFEQIGNELDDRYANLLFRGPWVPCFTVCSTGVGSIQRNVSKIQLKAELVPVPPKEEQRAIADKAEMLQQEVYRIIENKQSILEDLKAYKQSLVYEVVTGKREV